MAPGLPSGAELCQQLTELLAKGTGRHQLLGWSEETNHDDRDHDGQPIWAAVQQARAERP